MVTHLQYKFFKLFLLSAAFSIKTVYITEFDKFNNKE